MSMGGIFQNLDRFYVAPGCKQTLCCGCASQVGIVVYGQQVLDPMQCNLSHGWLPWTLAAVWSPCQGATNHSGWHEWLRYAICTCIENCSSICAVLLLMGSFHSAWPTFHMVKMHKALPYIVKGQTPFPIEHGDGAGVFLVLMPACSLQNPSTTTCYLMLCVAAMLCLSI